ncbi:hypothetical protein DM860_007320 [Cuscuta australis]|uniref:Stress-associated endoplasmic reticulum protein n=1 Tax=Cuscuta australis TaxID=267555 RepID=A0A328E7J4_9ASTE|nr:hypothetical protein DM860_007320 [Cuscuta australis]
MTTSKRVADRKIAKFEKNITRRGLNPSSAREKFEPTRIIIVLFAVLVIASFIFQVVRLALNANS